MRDALNWSGHAPNGAGVHTARERENQASGVPCAHFRPAGAAPQPARRAGFRIRECASPWAGALTAASEQLALEPSECLGRAVVGTQSQEQPPSVFAESCGPVDQFLHHGLDPPALGRVANRYVRPEQAALAHQAQEVLRQRCEFAHQVVAVELARGRPLQIQVGLSFGMALLIMRAEVGVQRHDLIGVELARAQAGGPAFKFDLGHNHLLAPAFDVALGEPENSTHGARDTLDPDGLFPDRDALACARAVPDGGGIGVQAGMHAVRVPTARVPLDQPVDLQLPGLVSGHDAAQHCGRVEPGGQSRRDRRLRPSRAQAVRQRYHALQVEVGLAHAVTQHKAQRQLEAEAMRAEVGRQRSVAVHPRAGARHAFLGRAAVVHREGVHMQWKSSAQQHTVVGALTGEQGFDHVRHALEERARPGIQALAQRKAGDQQRQTKCLPEERVAAMIFHRVEAALALHEQDETAPQDVAVVHPEAHRERGVQWLPCGLQRHQVATHQRHPGSGRESAVQLLDIESAHGSQLSAAPPGNSPRIRLQDEPLSTCSQGFGF